MGEAEEQVCVSIGVPDDVLAMETKTCSKCLEDKPLSEFGKRSDKPHLLKSWCNPCCANRARRFTKDATPERRQERRDVTARYRENNREKIRAYEKGRRNLDPEKQRQRLRAIKRKLRDDMIAAYGGKCSCCGESAYEFLTLEHTNGDGGKHRKELHSTDTILRRLRDQGWPKEGYTILCWNCNSSRGVYGYCPHQKKEGVPSLTQ